MGWPVSPYSAMRGSMGTSPRKSTPSSSATRCPPPWPKIQYRLFGRSGGVKYAMFSTMPRIGTFTLLNICRPLRASMSERSLAVVTITAPESGASCVSVSAASPVPGGMSITR